MTETPGEYVTMTPGFSKPAIGDVIAVTAVDWGMETEQHPATAGFTIVRGTTYGKVIKVNDEFISLAFQVFTGGDVRCVLSVPWCTVTQITILQHSEDGE